MSTRNTAPLRRRMHTVGTQFREVYEQYLELVDKRKALILIATDNGIKTREIANLLDCPITAVTETLKKNGYKYDGKKWVQSYGPIDGDE